MPRMIDSSMKTSNTSNGTFQFSAVRPEKLEATEYTLVNIVIDTTGSVWSFSKALLKTLKTVILSCKKSPRSDYMMIRVTTFNNDIDETHGFKLLDSIDPNTYQNLDCRGATALYDASEDAIASVLTYAKELVDLDFDVNGIVFIITDGMDNVSKMSNPQAIAKLQQLAYEQEHIESLVTVLIGINASQCKDELNAFKNDANLSQFVDAGKATPEKLAKLAAFVSQSISSQSQALGSNGPSQPLVF